MFAHGDRHDGAGSGPAEHPELEEIATLVDGRLSKARAARLRRHLAACDECREVFLDVVDLVCEKDEEEAPERKPDQPPLEPPIIRPIRPPSRRRFERYALPAAAAAAVAIGLAFYPKPPPNMGAAVAVLAAELAAPAYREPTATALDPKNVPRGIGKGHSQDLFFGLGRADAALSVSAEAKNLGGFDDAATKINQMNERLGKQLDPEAKAFFADLRAEASPGRDLRPLAKRAADLLDKYGPAAARLSIDFGRWTEAGFLAAAARDEGFLQSSAMRRFPAYLRKRAEGRLDPAALQAVGDLETLLERRELGPADFAALTVGFEKILKIYR